MEYCSSDLAQFMFHIFDDNLRIRVNQLFSPASSRAQAKEIVVDQQSKLETV